MGLAKGKKAVAAKDEWVTSLNDVQMVELERGEKEREIVTSTGDGVDGGDNSDNERKEKEMKEKELKEKEKKDKKNKRITEGEITESSPLAERRRGYLGGEDEDDEEDENEGEGNM